MNSLHLCDFPLSVVSDPVSFDTVLQVVADVRKYKTDKQISLGAEIEKLTIVGSSQELVAIQAVEDDIV